MPENLNKAREAVRAAHLRRATPGKSAVQTALSARTANTIQA